MRLQTLSGAHVCASRGASGYLGDAAYSVSPKYGRTCVAMLSVTATQLNNIVALCLEGWVGLILIYY